MADEGGDKTEEPTSKKLDDARKRGQVWKSKDLTSALVFFTGYAVMSSQSAAIRLKFEELYLNAMKKVALPGDPLVDAYGSMLDGLIAVVVLSLPVALAGAVVGGLGEFLQVGPLFTGDPIMPKLEKLNPIDGLKNIFSKKTAVELLKNLFKLTLAFYLAWSVLRDHIGLVTVSVKSNPETLLPVIGILVYRLTVKVGLLLVGAAIFDVWWQHKSYMKDMMMTKDEVKKEYKESEGDPHHKHKRKELHQEILEHSAIENVQNADVVVTNPTHYAVAIRYNREEDKAPKILAKGLDERAATIRELAKKHDVPMVRNIPLAHALHRLDIGDEIPEELYDAVAEVLNFVSAMSTSPSAEPPR